jgi:hypothetical protein
MDKAQIANLVTELIALGEDAGELNYWLDVYDDLEAKHQAALAANLTKELQMLKAKQAQQNAI